MHRLAKFPLVLSVVFASLAAPVSAENYNPRVGTRHADFTLRAIDDGRPVSLEQFRGKKVLLIQFASW
jgi:hypothetical protein